AGDQGTDPSSRRLRRLSRVARTVRIGRLTAIVPPSLVLILAAALPAGSAPPAPAAAAPRWTDATPDARVDDALARALAAGAPEHAQAAVLATIATLAPRAGHDHARPALGRIAAA